MQQGTWKPVAYMSKALNDVERNYDIYDKEMLGIMRALTEWRHYLQGTKQPFEIWTDHKNLEYFMTARKLNHQQARWSLELADYDFVLKHRFGQLNKKADLLSRCNDHKQGVDEDNTGVTVLKQLFCTSMRGEIRGEEEDLMKTIIKAKTRKTSVRETARSGEKDWKEEEGI